MLPRKVLALLFISKMAVSQSMYPTTAVSYSTSAVPTIQTLPVSPTISSIPPTVTTLPMSAQSATVTTLPMPTQSATVTAMPTGPSISPPSSPGVIVTTMPASPTVSLTSVSPVSSSNISPTSKLTEPKAHFLPASIPEPKVTILPYDTPAAAELSCLNDPYLVNIKDNGNASPVKRLTMACKEDVFLPDEETLCPGIPKNYFKPPSKGNKGNLNNPIDFEGLMDGFMSCL